MVLFFKIIDLLIILNHMLLHCLFMFFNILQSLNKIFHFLSLMMFWLFMLVMLSHMRMYLLLLFIVIMMDVTLVAVVTI